MMSSATNKPVVFWVLSVLGVLLLGYSLTRAHLVGLTIDEAFTFQRYVKNSNWFPKEYDMHSANYHMLNTWGMILCSKIFGIAEWSLRLPNVLAHALYIFFTAKFALRSKSGWSIVALFVTLNVHPYLLDFFSVARGYGLSFGFLAGSLWFVTSYFTKGKQLKHFSLTLLFAGLAVWSNFALLNLFVAVTLIIFLSLLIDKEITTRKKLTVVAIGSGISLLFLGVAYPVLAQLQAANAFFWNASGLWNQTVCVLAARLAYPLNGNIYDSPHAADLGMLGCILIAALIVGYAYYRNRNSSQRIEVLVLFAVLFVVMVEVVLQHLMFDVPYPSGRTALYLFVIVIWILAAALRDTMLPKRLTQIICVLIVSLQLTHATFTCNFSYTSEWAYCADVKNAILNVVIESMDDANDDTFGGVVIGCDQEFGNIISYYQQLHQTRFVSIYNCTELEDPLADFYIISPYVRHSISTTDTARRYPVSELLILRNSAIDGMKVIAASETAKKEKLILQDASSHGELFSYTYTNEDTAFARIDMQAQVQFTSPHAQCVIQYWHKRSDSLIWYGWSFVDAWPENLTGMHAINRNFPLKLVPNDVVSVSVVPRDSLGGPIEISQIKAHLQVSQ